MAAAPAASGERLILVTNDDGIASVGLGVLVEQLESLAKVLVVAPDQEQSAVGHSISLHRPMRVNQLAAERYAVSGSPADAVLIGLFHLCARRPDLVISGINIGLNLGTDVFYSGTVAGALEGAIHGIPALAVSQDPVEVATAEGPPLRELLERTARFAAAMAHQILAQPAPPSTALNVNAPAVLGARYCWTRLGRRIYREHVEKRLDLRGRPYYWVGGPVVRSVAAPGTDGYAIDAGLLSVTPLQLDLTAEIPSCYHDWTLDGFHRGE